VRIGTRPEEVVVSVHNSGSVIRADDVERIFDPFRQIATGEAAGGVPGSMGLGLYIAQQIAFSHGGWIEVQSAAGHGTTFLLHLPRSG
jgi:two-component system OmpR family sensor kinase